MPGTSDNIFSVQKLTHSEGKVSAIVVVNENSDILMGHFPGQPVVPGACMLQLVKDVLEVAISRKIQLKKADSIKFMSMIVPGGEKEFELVISYKATGDNGFAAQATLCSGEATCFKFQGMFVIE